MDLARAAGTGDFFIAEPVFGASRLAEDFGTFFIYRFTAAGMIVTQPIMHERLRATLVTVANIHLFYSSGVGCQDWHSIAYA